MHPRTGLVAAAGAATVALSLAVNGVATSQLPGGGLPRAAAGELTGFHGCDDLLAWYVAEALPLVGPYGLGGWWRGGPVVLTHDRDNSVAPAWRGAATVRESAVTGSATGTNVQEVGVDEPDRAKTDGSRVVHLRDRTLVVTEVEQGEARVVGRLRLPRAVAGAELLLRGDTVLVVGAEQEASTLSPAVDSVTPGLEPSVVDRRIMPGPWPGTLERTRLIEVSVADPESPEVVSDQRFGGALVSARQYDRDGGSSVRLVLRTSQPTLDFVQPHRDRTEREALRENRRLVRESRIEDWLPSVGTGDDRRPLVECDAVLHPDAGAGLGTLTVLTVPFDDVTARDALAVTASSETVYSSTDRLYLATGTKPSSTEVHAFELSETTTSYVASGRVPGRVRDRWSMDEHEGYLRVAVALGPDWTTVENGVVVLDESGDDLVEVGTVRGLGPDEEIKSVRWFDDLAIVVTFRQVDPLYTVDLSDPRNPRTLGALKVPGFSTYLHPLGEDRLLGLGQDATRTGRVRGGQAAVFDIADLRDPLRLDTLALGRHADPAASWDPRAFTWLPDRSTALTSVTDGWTGRSAVVALRVGDDGSLTRTGRWQVGWYGGSARTFALDDGTVVLVADGVRVLDLG